MTRRSWLTASIGAGCVLAYPTIVEPRWLCVSRTQVKVKGLRSSSAIRILHLADFHASHLVPHSLIDRAIELGLRERPHLACLTGDFITFRGGFDHSAYTQSLRRLTQYIPSFAVLGNHDGGSWAPAHGGFADHRVVEEMLAESGVTLLHNRSITIKLQWREINLVGLGDLWSEEIDTAAAFRGLKAQLPTILLSHNPDSKTQVGENAWDLMLCGHTHGGQVIVPFAGPCYAPVADKTYVAGLKEWRGRFIHVTRGVGSLGSVRFRCRPEVSILNLV